VGKRQVLLPRAFSSVMEIEARVLGPMRFVSFGPRCFFFFFAPMWVNMFVSSFFPFPYASRFFSRAAAFLCVSCQAFPTKRTFLHLNGSLHSDQYLSPSFLPSFFAPKGLVLLLEMTSPLSSFCSCDFFFLANSRPPFVSFI